MRPLRQTSKMIDLERRHGKPIREIVIEAIENGQTIVGAAQLLNVPMGTLYYWVQRLNIPTDTKIITRIAS